MGWLLSALKVEPIALVGSPPGIQGVESDQNLVQESQSDSPESSDARWLLESLERLVGDFRRHLEEQKRGKVANGTCG